ncbi:MAG: tetratricopeptide repeat protein [Candidatus Aminicenantes bacterium]|nr:tetratricopeptide repeat protein [Candidatus Aminicenantes bacterium]NIM79813.1 tetratricopeptide repeat protein [Candidatus Aminicenantes bacterium]NIN19143.1 tetratricopeptide repeat protein [Candidatus Aminicenantes bacterium]NIN43047.1 tetratricopeptide repeat protein [Candidatus Aminicenantes bacterium]NIN85788.1 tetratricopeptide repeat protein [Candidatus Aminicenantes bacterium]
MDPVTQLLLGFPLGIAANLGAELLLKLKKGIKWKDLEKLFIKSFSNALKEEDEKCKGGLKEFRGKISKNKKKILELFTTDAPIEKVGLFFMKIKTETFQKKVARRIVKEFSIGENFHDVLVIIVKQCLDNYEKTFLDTMTQEEGIKLIFKEQLHQTSELRTITILVKQVLSEKASKDDLKAHFEELKGLMLELIRIVSEGKVKARTRKKSVKKEKKKKQKQIKILSIMASPEGENYILYEQEQDTLLDAFKNFDREQVFLDMPDPVKSTLVEIREHLEDGKHDILHITAHGGMNENGQGVLSLEDHQGKLEQVTGKELLEYLKPTPKIVILSACHSARKEPDLLPTAQALYDAGIETVIGMKKEISDKAAIEFNAAFFKTLCEKKTVKEAFEKGKEAIFTGEQQRIKEIPGWDAVKEYEIPQLLAKDENLTVDNFSDHRIEAPGRPESHHFLGARYLERGFIGRRQVLRDIFKSIDNKEGAVVLKGPGGIGKSTLTTRTAANLRRKGYDFIVVRGETTTEKILEVISEKAAESGLEGAREVYAANIETGKKLAWYLDQFLLKQKVVIILDNFEENQDEQKAGEFKKERLKEFLWFFRDSLTHHDTFLMFSARYTMPGFDSPDITMNIPEFSPVEFRKMLLNSKALKSLDGKSVKTLMEEIGGNPRALDLLDSIAYRKYKQRDFTWGQLKDLIPKLRERIIEKKARGDDFSPLFLDTLFSYLSQPQRRLLDVLAIYRNPVPEEAAAAQDAVMEEEDRVKLEDLSLLECMDLDDKEMYYVHRLTAQHLLQQIKAAERKKYHKKAAGHFEALRDEEGNVLLDDLIEARWHYIQAGEWNKAAEITFSLEDYLRLRGYPQWAMELLREMEMEIERLNEEHQCFTYGKLGNLYKYCGEYKEALRYYNLSKEIAERINDDKNIASSLHGIGMVHQDQGRYEDALNHYERCREIFDSLEAKRELSQILHQIGMIYQNKGDYDAALIQYQKSMEIDEKIGDIKGVSSNLHQIGMIYQDKGDYEAALREYEKVKVISDKIGNIVGAALAMAQMGTLYFEQNQFEAALKYFIQAFLVFAKIGSPYANQAKQYITRVRENLPEEQFNAILKEFNLTPEVFDKLQAPASSPSNSFKRQ